LRRGIQGGRAAPETSGKAVWRRDSPATDLGFQHFKCFCTSRMALGPGSDNGSPAFGQLHQVGRDVKAVFRNPMARRRIPPVCAKPPISATMGSGIIGGATVWHQYPPVAITGGHIGRDSFATISWLAPAPSARFFPDDVAAARRSPQLSRGIARPRVHVCFDLARASKVLADRIPLGG